MNRMLKRFTLLAALLALFSVLTVTAWAEDMDDASESTMKYITEAQLVVYVDGEWDGALSDSYGLGETVSLTAPEVSGKQFSHWTADGSIISYSNPLTLTVNAHTTLYAVYAAEAPAAASATGFTSITRINDGTEISFQARADGTVTEAGIVYSTTVSGDDLIKGGTGVTTVTAVKLNGLPSVFPDSVLDSNNCWTLRIKPENDETVYHARTYMVSGGNTIYGDVKDVKLSELDSGYFLIVDPNSIDPNSFEEGSLAEKLEELADKNDNGNDNSGGNDYSGGGTPAATTVTVPVSGDDETVNVKVEIKDDTATIKEADIDKVLEAEDVGTVTIDVSSLKETVNEVVIPGAMVDKIADAVADENNDANGLEISLPTGTVSFDAEAVAAIAEQTDGKDLTLHLDDVKVTELTTAQQDAVKELEVEIVLDAYLTSNGQRISDFKGGSATVKVPYTLKDGQTAQGIVVWYVADDGTKTQVPATYDGKNVVFTVPHFSNYVIAYDAEKAAACPKDDTCPMAAFTDLDPTLWYHDGIHFCLENGVMNGVGNGKFDPTGTTSRAMIVTILYRLEGEPAVTGENPFTDVEDGKWYTNAVLWAAENDIVGGYGNGKFGPNDPITREQLATILYRYAQSKGQGFTGAWMFLLDYPDASEISSWADEAMHWCVMNGIINGKDGKLVPGGDASRAEAATMLMRYCTKTAE